MPAETQPVRTQPIETIEAESMQDRLTRLDKAFGSSQPGAFCSSPEAIKLMIEELSGSKPANVLFLKTPKNS